MLRVLAETAYPPIAPSARVRIARFAPFLREHGVGLTHWPTLTDDEYQQLSSHDSVPRKLAVLVGATARAGLRSRPTHELLLVHRLRLLNPFPGLDPPPRLDVYDLDDALFVGSAAPVNRSFAWAKQEARRCVSCLRRARLVIAGNGYLAGRAKEHARRVEVVPTCVDPTEQQPRNHQEVEVVTIGWIGSHTTSAYLQPVLPVVERLNGRGVRVKLVLVGADATFRAPWIEHRPWSLLTEARDLASFDVGIMPLPATEWARGKCGYKVLQYFAASLPAVASPVGVAPELIGTERGFLATSAAEWERALEALVNNVVERRQRGLAGREFVERHYSYQRWAGELAGLLQSVTS
jgi:glycosyltransferase involved in cell wall biosynthesis